MEGARGEAGLAPGEHREPLEEEWPGIFERLERHARCLLRSREERGESRDLAQRAIFLWLDGGRAWNRKVDFECFLRGIARSLRSSGAKQGKRQRTDSHDPADFDAIEAAARFAIAPPRSPEESLAEAREEVAAVALFRRVAAGDADLESLVASILDGGRARRDLASDLGWDAIRVSLARLRMQRRILVSAPGHEKHARRRK